MKWEYLTIRLNTKLIYEAFDGDSVCDGDRSLVKLLNKLGLDRWEYAEYVNDKRNKLNYHLLKRSLP